MKITVSICRGRRPQPKRRIRDMPAAVLLVQEVIDEIGPWPETVMTAVPGYTAVVHKDFPGYTLTGRDRMKMNAIADEVRHRLRERCDMAQVPDIQLIADTGAVTSIWAPAISGIGQVHPDERDAVNKDLHLTATGW